jgi:hypothetical protein
MIVYPTIVSFHGKYETADLNDFRRFLSEDGKIYLEITFNENKLKIELELNSNLYAKTSAYQKTRYSCYFHGFILNESNSFVSVSLCNGMVKSSHLFNFLNK